MAGWESLGSGLGDVITGNPNGDALAFAKGSNLGANTEVALAKARESNMQEQARQRLKPQLVAAGVPDAVADASAGVLAAGGGLGDVVSLLGKQQEQGFRQHAVDSALGNDIARANANMIGVASGPVESLYSVGEGQYANKFSGQTAPTVSPLGDALVGQRNAAAALDDAHRLHPESFMNPNTGNPYLIVNGTPFLKPPTPGGPLKVAPGFNNKVVADNAGALAGAKAGGKAVGTNAAGLPSALNDLDTMSGNVDKLLADPNVKDIYGANVGQLTRFVPGSGSARAAGIRTQLGSEAFSAAVQKMRGLGALSNAEGQKVQTALTRALDPMLKPEDAAVALGELKLTLANLRKVAIKQAGGEDKLAQLLGGTESSAPGTSDEPVASTGFSDPDKEARYQAWKAQQGAQ